MNSLFDQPGVSLSQTDNGGQILHLQCEHFDAALSLNGGQLLQFCARGAQPLLYFSPLTVVAPGKAIRGGVPVCWPWFGPHPQDRAAPQHGTARTSLWHLRTLASTDTGFELTLRGPAHDGLESEIRYILDDQIRIELTTHNRGDTPRRVSAALHSYLAVSDAGQITVRGLAGTRYLDKTTGQNESHPQDTLRINGELDRIIYTGQVEVDDPVWSRTLRIEQSGSNSTVLWNPGVAKTQTMKDLPADAWRHFICVEAANAGEDERLLAPGAVHTLGTRIRAMPL